MLMKLSSDELAPTAGKVIYTCPMHPEVQQDHPGNCPKCGMTLEPKTVSAVEKENPELTDMTHRFWIGGVLALPVFLLAMAHLIPALGHEGWSWVTRHAGFNSFSQHQSCYGRVGHFLNAAGIQSLPGS